MLKKISFVTFVGFFVVVFSGCVKKTEAPSTTINQPSAEIEKDNIPPASPTSKEEVLPKATGKVDDLVGAVSLEADSEKTTLSDEEKAASEAASDAEEINNLENSYDENEL